LDGLDHIHILPLLHETFPDVPVLQEHTGAMLRTEHSKHSHAWGLLSGIVALVIRDYRIVAGGNVASIAALTLENNSHMINFQMVFKNVVMYTVE
jgi:hypothetical protein